MISIRILFRFAFALLVTLSLLSCGKKSKKVAEQPQSTAEPIAQTQTTAPARTTTPAQNSEKRTPLRLMSYNLENMFDAKHDIETNRAGKEFRKNDAEFLPTPQCIDFFEFLKNKCAKGERGKTCRNRNQRKIRSCKKGENNWTEEKYRYKLGQVKKVFDLRKEKSGEKTYPDIVAFSEIENSGVTVELAKLLGYGENDNVTTKSFDNRGIDLAVLYRPNKNFKKISHHVYPIKRVELEGGPDGRRGGRPTRPILEVIFEFYGKPLHILVNHWPSLGGPTKLRNFAAEMLRKIIEQRYAENPEIMFLALGDFNTADLEKQASEPHPFRDILLNGLYGGTPPALFDVHHEALKKGHKLPPGSYYYGDKWQNLDRFFVSSNLLDRNFIDIDLASYNIFNAEELSEPCNPEHCHVEPRPLVPYRYKHSLSLEQIKKEGQGFSDHYPTYLTIQ